MTEPDIRTSASTWWKQLCTLTKRSFLNMTRDMGYYWLRIIFYVMVSITIGTLFYHTDTHNTSIIARVKCIAFIYGSMICLSCGGLPFFLEELKVKLRIYPLVSVQELLYRNILLCDVKQNLGVLW